MYFEAPSLHATEPRHLPLGKLVDGYFKAIEHLVVSQLSRQVFRHELGLHFFHHTCLQTGLQTAGDLLTAQFPVDIDADNQRLHRRQLPPGHRMLQIVCLNLYRPDGPLTRIHIRRIVHVRPIAGLQLLQHLRQ